MESKESHDSRGRSKQRRVVHSDLLSLIIPYSALMVSLVALVIAFWQGKIMREGLLLNGMHEYRPYVVVDTTILDFSSDSLFFTLQLRNVGKSSARRLFVPAELAVPSDARLVYRPAGPAFDSRFELLTPLRPETYKNPLKRGTKYFKTNDLHPGTRLYYFFAYEYGLSSADLLGDSIITYVHYGIVKFISDQSPLEKWYEGEATFVGRPDSFGIDYNYDSTRVTFYKSRSDATF